MNESAFTLKHILIIALLMLLVGVGIGSTFFKKTVVVRTGTADTPAAMTSVNLMVDFGSGTIKTWNTISWHEAMSVMNLMEFVASTQNITLTSGTAADGNPTVLGIDGLENNTAKHMRWQYWVNNNYESIASSKYFLKPGDIVVWKYATEQAK